MTFQHHQDTHFFSAEAALRHASALLTQNEGHWMQCCYYDGEKLSTNLPKLFHQPFYALTSDLTEGLHRIPTAVSFENTDFTSSKIAELGIRSCSRTNRLAFYSKNDLDTQQFLQGLTSSSPIHRCSASLPSGVVSIP